MSGNLQGVLLCWDVLALEERPRGDPGIEGHAGEEGEQLWAGGDGGCNQDVNTGDRTASDNRICAK